VRAIVLFADVTASRRNSADVAAWLRRVTRELDDAYGGQRLASFGFTQGDELQGLLRPTADPFSAVLRVGLHPEARRVRWAIAAGEVESGRGPATQRTGPAFLVARELIGVARAERDELRVRTGDEATDALLDDVAPLLPLLLGDLTDRQRQIARLMLVDGLRQADAAERLEIKRPTASVLAERARVREIERLARGLGRLVRHGLDGVAGADPAA
jgi:DNA-binding CsgD family transcriptional regulator